MTLNGLNYSYETYQCLEIVIPSVIFVLIFIHFIISVSLFFGKRCIGTSISNGWSEGFFSDIIYPYANVLFRSSLKKNRVNGFYKVQLHRYKIHRFEMFLLSPLTSLIIALACFAFWDAFLIQETYVCNPQLDCFERDFILVVAKPIDNCTLLNTTKTVICYEFVFNLVGGFSSAVGVVGIFVLYFNMNLTILHWLKRKSHHSCRLGFVVIIGLPYIIIFISIVLVLIFIDFVEQTDLFSLQILPYCIGFLILAPISAQISRVIGSEDSIADFQLPIHQGEYTYSPSFYAHSYRMRVVVYQSTQMHGAGSVRISVRLMPGPYNKWPFQGYITMKVLNQAGDHCYVEERIQCIMEKPTAENPWPINAKSPTNAENPCRVIVTEHGQMWIHIQDHRGNKIFYSRNNTFHIRVLVSKVTRLLEVFQLQINQEGRMHIDYDQESRIQIEPNYLEGDLRVYSPAFYTDTEGYQMCVSLQLHKGLSISTHLMQGPFDDYLKWPFRGEIIIQIVNEAEYREKLETTHRYIDDTPGARVITQESSRSEGLEKVHHEIPEWFKQEKITCSIHVYYCAAI